MLLNLQKYLYLLCRSLSHDQIVCQWSQFEKLEKLEKKVKDKKLGSQDKGQKSMIDSWLKGIQNGEPCIDYNSLMQTSLATILSIESLSIGMPLDVDSKLYKIKSS